MRALLPLWALLASFAHAELETVTVQRAAGGEIYRAEGVIEAVRHAELAAQVPGRVLTITVKAGDSVAAGTELIAIDARAARDQQVAARAQFDAAQRDYQRARELFAKNIISRAAMDQAEAQFRVARAQANVAGTQSDFHRITAPYAGIVADIPVEVGDMAQPGRPLLRFYDPAQLRITAPVPESVAGAIATATPVHVELNDTTITAVSIEILPTVDPQTHTRELRVLLPAGTTATPGAFARALLPLASASATLRIPVAAIVTRTEFHGVYVVAASGHAQLRQVRLGRRHGDFVDVLAGLREGEHIALQPLQAMRVLNAGEPANE